MEKRAFLLLLPVFLMLAFLMLAVSGNPENSAGETVRVVVYFKDAPSQPDDSVTSALHTATELSASTARTLPQLASVSGCKMVVEREFSVLNGFVAEGSPGDAEVLR